MLKDTILRLANPGLSRDTLRLQADFPEYARSVLVLVQSAVRAKIFSLAFWLQFLCVYVIRIIAREYQRLYLLPLVTPTQSKLTTSFIVPPWRCHLCQASRLGRLKSGPQRCSRGASFSELLHYSLTTVGRTIVKATFTL